MSDRKQTTEQQDVALSDAQLDEISGGIQLKPIFVKSWSTSGETGDTPAFVKSWKTSGDADDRPTEEVAFNYSKVEWTYTPQKN